MVLEIEFNLSFKHVVLKTYFTLDNPSLISAEIAFWQPTIPFLLCDGLPQASFNSLQAHIIQCKVIKSCKYAMGNGSVCRSHLWRTSAPFSNSSSTQSASATIQAQCRGLSVPCIRFTSAPWGIKETMMSIWQMTLRNCISLRLDRKMSRPTLRMRSSTLSCGNERMAAMVRMSRSDKEYLLWMLCMMYHIVELMCNWRPWHPGKGDTTAHWNTVFKKSGVKSCKTQWQRWDLKKPTRIK